MHKIKIKEKHGLSHVARQLEKTEYLNKTELDILNKQEIFTLYPSQQSFSVQKKKLCYSFETCDVLSGFLERGMDFDLFCRFVLDLVQTIQACDAYGIRSSNLELNPDAILFDEKEQSFRFLFWPLITLENVLDFREEFRTYGLQFCAAGQDQECKRRYLNFFESRAKFNIEQFGKYVLSLSEWWVERAKKTGERGFSLTDISTGRRMEPKQFPFVVGRAMEGCGFSCPGDKYMGRQHFALYMQSGMVYLRDLGSLNGTILNETQIISKNSGAAIPDHLPKLEESAQIRHGDYIRAGRTVFQIMFL